jgi:tetratricopeptide (TPR) repeat protein
MTTLNADRELLARLGLEPGADATRIREAHAALVQFLASAPKGLRPWVRRQQADVEAAYRDLQAPSNRTSRTAGSPAMPASTRRGFMAADGDEAEELLDALDDSSRPAPRVTIPHQPVRVNAATRSLEPGRGLLGLGGYRRLGLAIAGLAVVAVAVVGIYKLGAPSVPGLTGTPAPNATAALDEAKVLELMQQLNTNPKDVAVLRQLADLYYTAGDNATSRKWLLKVLEIEPKNVEALLGAGATAYNLDDFTAAEDAWRQVIAIDPKNVDAHYDLGLMYFSMDPPKLDQMREAWNAVIQIAPDSQLASIVRTHMPSPSESPAGSGAPATSGQPSAAPASPAASTAPASSPAPAAS